MIQRMDVSRWEICMHPDRYSFCRGRNIQRPEQMPYNTRTKKDAVQARPYLSMRSSEYGAFSDCPCRNYHLLPCRTAIEPFGIHSKRPWFFPGQGFRRGNTSLSHTCCNHICISCAPIQRHRFHSFSSRRLHGYGISHQVISVL